MFMYIVQQHSVTYEELKESINDPEITNICWLEETDGSEEMITCTSISGYTETLFLIEKSLFDYKDFKEWCKNNADKILAE